MLKLSPHFTLEELTITQIRGVDNSCPDSLLVALADTAKRLEAVRALLGYPVIVNSGYRCPTVNRIVGGAKNSAHMAARAVDFICPSFGAPISICRAIEASDLQFDQLIEEGSWVHISFDPKMRRQVLTKSGSGYVAGLTTAKV
jgi:hypothetical protein